LWRFLQTIEATQLQARIASAISPARAFWWSSPWFSGGPYINRHLNGLDNFAKGKASPAGTAPGLRDSLRATT